MLASKKDGLQNECEGLRYRGTLIDIN